MTAKSIGDDELAAALDNAKTQDGDNLAELSRRGQLLVTFLRHFGCTFCREALTDLAKSRAAIESGGTRLALVHVGKEDAATREFFADYGLEDVPRVADPQGELYGAVQLRRAGLRDWLFNPGVWQRSWQTAWKGYGFGFPNGDVLRLGGSFLISDGRIVKAFRTANVADRPDYEELAACPASARS